MAKTENKNFFANEDDFELSDIVVKGAREHNLKNIDVKIPRDKITVITGLSGSGKSSLAFDTLYAEGQRRYVECLSAYARQFLGMMKKPDVDVIEGLSPAISIEQKTLGHNPRSTVGTVTEIYDYLRLLFAKIGLQYSVEFNVPVIQRTTQQIVDEIVEGYVGKRIQILAPIVKARKGHYRELFEQLMKQGFTRARVDGEVIDLREGMQLARYKIHDIEIVIDRLKFTPPDEQRLTESINLALHRGESTMMLLWEDDKNEWHEKLFSTNYACPISGRAYEKLAPNMFSFNSPYGACPTCNGLGELMDFNLELIIPDKSVSFAKNGFLLLDPKKHPWLWTQVESVAAYFKIDLNKPIGELTEEQMDLLLFGKGVTNVDFDYNFGAGKKINYKQKYEGILSILKHQSENSASSAVRKKLESFMTQVDCPTCAGGRLKEESLFVFINDTNIRDIQLMTIDEAHTFFTDLQNHLNQRDAIIANLILKEICERLEFLKDVGLSYLNLGRAARTLSGGEAQRIRLASQIGSKLVGITYVLDEPSIGLHQHDNYKLINSLKNLRDLGNTLIVVEHDKAMIEEADFFIDMGPRAGVHGGEVILMTDPKEIYKYTSENSQSITAQYLNNEIEIEYSAQRRDGNGKFITLSGARGNNLKNVTLKLPLGKMVVITGMSGSGKSSLINDTLYPILSRYFYNSQEVPLVYDKIEGLDNIDKIIEIDQKPIGRTPRSNPSTYTGIFTIIRDFYAMLPESKMRGYKAGRFSFNVASGRCEACEGAGLKKIEMNFLPNVYVKCDECDGKRYNKETLTVHFKGKSIADVLDMTVEEALEFFRDIPKINQKLKTLNEVGLSYITLGQQAPTLSGGEAQRVKLATELSKKNTGKTLYLLDEPTTGLHFEDIRILQKLLNELVEKGNTVVIIEHNLDVIKCADWIVDLGPEGGKGGGMIIAEGTPEKVAKSKLSLTAKYLKDELKKK